MELRDISFDIVSEEIYKEILLEILSEAEDYLKSYLYDFYITMHTFSYRVEKLTEDEQEHLKRSLKEIEQALEKNMVNMQITK